MSTRIALIIVAAFATAALPAEAAETGANDDTAELRSKLDAALTKIAEMDAKIASLESAGDETWLTEQRAAEIRDLVQDVIADADTRTSLLQAGMTAGYDDGFILSTADGNWLLKTNFLMQQRFVFNRQHAFMAPGVDTTRTGFENTRSTFMLSGHIVSPEWFYRVDVNVGSNGGGAVPEDVRTGTLNSYLGYDFGMGLKFFMGAAKLPFLREELVEAQYQQAVERSILNYGFTLGYSDGLQVQYQMDAFKFYGAFSNGFYGAHQAFNQPGPFGNAEYAFTGRVEWKAAGNWDEFEEFTSPRGQEFGILLGGAAHYERQEYGTLSGPEVEYLFATGDITVQFGGANFFASLVWNDVNNSPLGDDFNPWGFLLQAGIYVEDTWEIFARYEWADSDTAFSDDELSVVTVGFNKYFHGQNSKWTTDIGYGLQPVVGAGQFNGLAPITDWRQDIGTNEGQFVIRTQWQLLF
jgi:hypothetical protein